MICHKEIFENVGFCWFCKHSRVHFLLMLLCVSTSVICKVQHCCVLYARYILMEQTENFSRAVNAVLFCVCLEKCDACKTLKEVLTGHTGYVYLVSLPL